MTAEHKSFLKTAFRNAFIVLLLLAGLLLMSLWADRRSAEVEGPSRLVEGPHHTVYIQIDRSIAKASSEGELLSVLDLDTDASIPDVTDFFVEEDERLLFARRDSQLLQYYSPEGKPLNTPLRMPSPPNGENNSCSLTKDRSTGILYFADTSRNRIRIFGPNEKEIKTITVPSGAPASSPIGGRRESSDLERVFSSETPLQHPTGLTFAKDRLIAADAGNSRLVLFYPDGTLDKIVSVFPLESSSFINPVRVDRSGDTIYAVVRGPGFDGGKVQAFEFNTGLPKNFRYSGSSDPWDILARPEDVLVADRASLAVIRYAHSGRFLGVFGKPDLQRLYAGSQFKRKTYEWIREGSLAGVAAVFGWLLFTLVSRLSALRNLGPPRSARGKILLLVPAMGQAAAGRPLRAVILLLILLYFVSFFVYSWLQYRSQVNAPLSLTMLVASGLMAYSVWISVVLDGIRLTGKPGDNEDTSVAKRRRLAVFVPLVTVCSAAMSQLAREFIVSGYPVAPPAIQQLFYSLTAMIRANSSFSASALPASVLFGWGGASAALFGVLAWQAKARRSEIATGIVAGFLAGIYSWLFTAVIAGNGLGWMFYAPPIQGALLGLFTYLYFRGKGMPALVMPAAIAGAWIGHFLKFFFGVLSMPIVKALSKGDAAGFWTGAMARLELILIPSFFIHLAIQVTGDIALDKPAGNVEAAIRKEDGLLVQEQGEMDTDMGELMTENKIPQKI